jgi:hypothetical protein
MSRTSHSANARNSGWNIIDTSSIPTKEMYMWRKRDRAIKYVGITMQDIFQNDF